MTSASGKARIGLRVLSMGTSIITPLLPLCLGPVRALHGDDDGPDPRTWLMVIRMIAVGTAAETLMRRDAPGPLRIRAGVPRGRLLGVMTVIAPAMSRPAAAA